VEFVNIKTVIPGGLAPGGYSN